MGVLHHIAELARLPHQLRIPDDFIEIIYDPFPGVRTTFRVDMESGKFLNAPLFDDVVSRQVVFKK